MSEQGKMRLTLVTLGVTLASVAVIGNAFYQKKQFYPSIVFLTKSNPSVAVLYAQSFVMVFLVGKAMRKIFFGQLRTAEVEHLIEKFWYVITETCLAFTVFRDDFSPRFVALFTFLLFMKAFHWLVEDRVDYMERSPLIGAIFHLRICSLLTILGTIDAVLIHHAFKTTVASGASVQMVFGFEYAILLTMVVATLMRYSLHVVDNVIALEHPWENRNVYLLYGELITGFVKCCLYLAFVVVMVKIHTFPLFAIRPMYLTIRGFKKALSDVILSRRAIAYMNTRFPDVTLEELERLDITTCIICRDRLVVGKKLPCNHIFHTHCLRSWFQRQQSCPTCRLDVLSARPPMQTPNQQQQQQQQPQQQQQQQQQQQGVQPAQMPPGFMNMPPFGMFPPQPPQMQMPPQPPQMPMPPQPPPATTHASTTPTTATTEAASAMSAGSPPLFNNSMFGMPVPPMPGNMFSGNPMASGMPNSFMSAMPGMPFPPPPVFPSMNLDMSAFSVEQLKDMEGQERENVEARIRVLRNVHSLLDAVIIQLNQYSNVITSLNAMEATVNPGNTAASVPESSTTEPSTTTTLLTNPKTTRKPQSTEDVNNDMPVVENVDFSQLGASSSAAANTELPELSSAENELRRRRLERFESLNKKEETEEKGGE